MVPAQLVGNTSTRENTSGIKKGTHILKFHCCKKPGNVKEDSRKRIKNQNQATTRTKIKIRNAIIEK